MIFKKIIHFFLLLVLLGAISFIRFSGGIFADDLFKQPFSDSEWRRKIEEQNKQAEQDRKQKAKAIQMERVQNLVVMIKAQSSVGAGIIFGQNRDHILITTANHVVRHGEGIKNNIKVQFRSLPDNWLPANLLETFADRPLDIAVLSVKKPLKQILDPCSLPFDSLPEKNTIKQKSPVYPIGYPNGAPWAMPVVPDWVSSLVGNTITFQSTFISPGNSGGGLLNENGELVGMVQSDQPPFGVAILMEQVLRTLRRWGYPVQLYAHRKDRLTPLHQAVKKRNLEEVRHLLADTCVDIEASSKTSYTIGTPLHLAVTEEQPEIVQLLVDSHANVNAKGYRGIAPLHLAAENGTANIARILLEKGADVEVKDRLNHTPLHYASREGHLKMAKLLLARGAKVNPEQPKMQTPLHHAVLKGNLDLVKVFLAAGGRIDTVNNWGKTPLDLVLNRENTKDWNPGQPLAMIKLLIGHGAKLSQPDFPNKNPLNSILLEAPPDLELATLLLANGLSIEAPTDFDGNTLMHRAAEMEKTEIMRFLLSQGANLNAKNKNGLTPLWVAQRWDRVKSLEFILDSNVTLDWDKIDVGDLLSWAAAKGETTVLKLLLARNSKGKEKLVISRTTLTSALLAAAAEGNVQTMKLLIAAKAKVNLPIKGKRSLHEAIRHGHLEAAKLLIAEGADLEAFGFYGRTPLQLAAIEENIEIMKLLLAAGADINARSNGERSRDGLTALHWAVGHLKVVQFLLKAGADPNAKDHRGDTPLHEASENSGKDMKKTLQALLEAGADVNARDNEQRTPLHSAVINGRLEAVKSLLAAGADVNAQTDKQETALHFAAKYGMVKIAQLLLEAKADPHAKDWNSRTPLEEAGENEVADLLRAYRR